MRALLESIAFRVSQLVDLMHKEIPIACSHIRADGGVSKNDFITQLIADLSGYRVERASTCDHSALGAAFMAGIAAGVFFPPFATYFKPL